MKPVWKGDIHLGALLFPVELYPATEARSLGFKIVHERCTTPLTYQRWCAYCNEVIPWENVVKSIKLKDNLYFVVTPESLQKLRSTRTETLHITECIDPMRIPPIYINSHYYILPQEGHETSYTLLLMALARLGQAAIGTFTLRDKEYVCVIQPYKKGLLLSTLYYEYEVRPMKKVTLTKPKGTLAKDELKLILDSINHISSSLFTMKKYKNTFPKRLQKEVKDTLKQGILDTLQKRKKQ